MINTDIIRGFAIVLTCIAIASSSFYIIALMEYKKRYPEAIIIGWTSLLLAFLLGVLLKVVI